MIGLAISEFIRNIRRNAILILLLTFMGGIVLFVSSVIIREYQRYAPFSAFEGKEGFFYAGGEYTSSAVTTYSTSYVNVYDIEGITGDDTATLCISALPKWVWKKWKPRLENGLWLDEIGEYENIPVVAGGTAAAALTQIGDVIKVKAGTKEIRLLVVGILVARTEVFGTANTYKKSNANYDEYFSVNYDPLFFVTKDECLQKAGVSLGTDLKKITLYNEGKKEEAEELKKKIDLLEGNTIIDLKEFNDNSRLQISKKIRTYLPLVICAMLLICICSYAAVYIAQARSLKHHGIFYLLGADLKKRFFISMGNGMGVTLFSALLLVIGVNLVKVIGLDRKIIFTVNEYTIYFVIALYILYFIMLCFMVLLSMRKLSPKEVIRNTKE